MLKRSIKAKALFYGVTEWSTKEELRSLYFSGCVLNKKNCWNSHGDVLLPGENFEKIIRNELQISSSWNSIPALFPGKEWNIALETGNRE